MRKNVHSLRVSYLQRTGYVHFARKRRKTGDTLRVRLVCLQQCDKTNIAMVGQYINVVEGFRAQRVRRAACSASSYELAPQLRSSCYMSERRVSSLYRFALSCKQRASSSFLQAKDLVASSTPFTIILCLPAKTDFRK